MAARVVAIGYLMREREREERGSVGSPFKRGYVCLHAESIFPDACICIEAEAVSGTRLSWEEFYGLKSELFLPFYLSYPPKLQKIFSAEPTHVVSAWYFQIVQCIF